ncbi:MAG TPA: nucleotidyltransferase family protein [Rhodocyclaceae bacterium]|nr:nucleotidyltransferase family protein [Rhodocyclaceae bacterium]
MTLADWDATLRIGRRARLLGVLADRLLDRVDCRAALPAPVPGHLQAACNYAAYRMQQMRMELRALDAALPREITVVLLKGAAYVVQGLPAARGRIPSDVDLMVRRDELDRAEAALHAAGWRSGARDAYDERYYREWSHELPPLRYPGHPLEVDLHHTIAPVTSRTRADDATLLAGLQAVPASRFFVLAPADQIVHAAIHLFQDSELTGHLRDLVDIDALVRHHLRDEAGWEALFAHAERHRAARLLWYALRYCRAWLGTPVPARIALQAPPRLACRGMDWLVAHCCLPQLPGEPPALSTRVAMVAARARYHWLRMPVSMLALHLAHKGWRRLRPRRAAAGGAA